MVTASLSSGEGSSLAILFIIILAFIIQAIGFGMLTRYICRTKGRKNGFAWGFWLGLIGLLVVGFLPNLNATEKSKANGDIDTLEKLASLHEKGVLTDKEFEQKKADILAKL